jgi:hypothetical protein
MAHDEDVPLPSPPKGRPTVALPALTAAKHEAYRAMRAAGLNKEQLAERLGWQPSRVTRACSTGDTPRGSTKSRRRYPRSAAAW